MLNNIILCPNCNNEIYYRLDDFGRAPVHLHCDNCKINIGATSFKKCKELLEQYHNKNTYIEYYSNKIQFLSKEGRIVINEERCN